MAVNTGDTGNAEMRELGASLRRLRDECRMTVRALAEASGQAIANISHWENGTRLPREDRLASILDALNAPIAERERLLELRRRSDEGPGQLIAGSPSIGEQLTTLIEYEQVARRIVTVAPLKIPGLLQTADYARAVFQGLPDIETRVRLRVGRRDILTRRDPVELLALIDSEVLVRPVASADVMIEQLHHLLTMGQRPNVEIRLVSSTHPGHTPMLDGPFIFFEFPVAAPIVHLEHRRASLFLKGESADIEGFSAAVEEISSVAMTPAQSAEVIAKIVDGLETR